MDTQKTKVARRGPFEMSTDARILFNMLEKTIIKEHQDIVTYKQLSQAIDRNVQGRARGLLNTARRHIWWQYKVLIETVRNVGVKVSEDREGCLSRTKEHCRKMSRRAVLEVGHTLNGKEITPALAADLSILGAVTLLASPKTPKQLIEKLEKEKLQELSSKETIRLFLTE